MANNKKTPAIRFKGFNDDWELRKLKEVAEIVGGGTPSTGNPEYWNGDIDWYSPTEIGDHVYARGSTKKITKLGLEKSSAKILPQDKTVLFTSRAGIGDMAILQRPGATNQGFQSLVLKEEIDTYFIYSMGHLIKKYAEKNASGSTFLEISGRTLGDMPILMPSTNEQTQIGTFFKTLDNLITLHQRKCDKLIIFKKAMLEKMFPKNGENLPEVRFEGFNDDWEQRKLGEITNSIDTGRSKFVSNSNGEYEILGSTSVIGYDDNYDYEGDFLLTARVGANAGELYRHSGRVKISDNTVFIQGKNLNFIFYMLMNFDIKKLSFGTGQPLIKASELRELELMLPKSSEEQQKIGTFFNSLDNLITLHQRKVEKLKIVKKSMLEKMFI